MADDNAQRFIQFGNERIKTGNIKSYGISTEDRFFEKVYRYEVVPVKRFGLINSKSKVISYGGKLEPIDINRVREIERGNTPKKIYLEIGERIPNQNTTASHNGIYSFDEANLLDVVKKQVNYLYVTTYQNENYVFYDKECGFNIKEKRKELDSFLC